jgi:hypothetical protein
MIEYFLCMSKQISYSTKTHQGEKATMKIRNLILVLSALALPLQAAEVGVSHLSLPVTVTNGKTQLVGVFLARPVLQKGKVASDVTTNNQTTNNTTIFTAATAVFPTNVATETSWTGVGTAGSELAPRSDEHYVIEFTSGPKTGLIKQVSRFPTTSTAEVQGKLSDIIAGTTFVLRKDHTLASLFGDGTNGSPIQITDGPDPSDADVVSLYFTSGATGVWKQFIYVTNIGWRMVGDLGAGGLDRSNVRVSLGTGFAFNSLLGGTIYLNGEYRGSRSRITIENSKGSVVANPYPVAVKLKDTGLADYLLYKTASILNADKLYFLENGNFATYFNNGSTGFKKDSNSSYDANEKLLGVGEAFLLKPRTQIDVAFAPQYINP